MATTITEQQATSFVNQATGLGFKSFADIQAHISAVPQEQNERLTNINNKLIKMLTIETFKQDKFGFENTMAYGGQQVEIGAQLQIIGLPLVPVKDDTIANATDLLPEISGDTIPLQFVKTYITNFKKRVELIVNASVFERAFTSIGAFNSFIALYNDRIVKSMKLYFFEQGLAIINTGVKLSSTIAGSSADVKAFFTGLYEDWATTAPYTDKFNLGGDYTTTPATPTIPAGTNNTDGLDVSMPVKKNTTDWSKDASGKLRFNDSILFVKASTLSEYNQKALADTYHDDYLALEKLFSNVVLLPDDFKFAGTGTEPKYGAFVLSNLAFLRATNIKALKTQFWAKGEGRGIYQMVMSHWTTMGVIPFANGKKYVSGTTK